MIAIAFNDSNKIAIIKYSFALKKEEAKQTIHLGSIPIKHIHLSKRMLFICYENCDKMEVYHV
jgi:hypothetical protein